MAEIFFLQSVATYLRAAGLTPAAALVGSAEPAATTDLPAIVLSLESTARLNPGIGERSQTITHGVLPWSVTIDLANPVLADDPTVTLLDTTRTKLILPHGGLVKADGSDPGATSLAPADITVSVAGASRAVVAAAPSATQVVADPQLGTLTFGAALPAVGIVAVTYFLGQWEQRVERIAGVLRIDVCADVAANAQSLSDGVTTALLLSTATKTLTRLITIAPTSLGSIGIPETSPALRRRTSRFTFSFEHEINEPPSSGGVIERIQITSQEGDGLDPPGVLAGSSELFTVHA